jgi:polysaccharide pyruvyl transferase WcaK-like protein
LSKEKKILLIGSYNAGNIGDDALMTGALNGLRKFLPEYEVKILAPNGPTDYYLLPTGLRSFLKLKWIFTLFSLRKFKYLVFGGGGILNPEEYKSLIVWGVQIVVAKFFGLKVILLANSFSSLDSALLKYLLTKVDFITCRDSHSFKLLNQAELGFPIKRGADLSFLVNDGNKIDEFEFDSDDFIVLNLRKYKNVDFELQKDLFLNLVDLVTKNTNFSIYLLPFDSSDLLFMRQLSNLVKENGRVFLLPYEPDVILSAFKKSKLVVTQRLHPALFAVKMNKNFISLSYSSKVFSLLYDLGLHENVYDLRNDNFDTELVCNRVLEAILNQEASLNEQDVNFELIKKEAEDNFRLLKTYLE